VTYTADQIAAVLRAHWLRAMECHHATGMDTPHCACCAWPCPPQPNIGAAAERWIEHVLSELAPKVGS
jgi:hypothetical protein